MRQKPAVSVIIPVYNRERYIGQAIDSVLRQTLTDFEIIIVDDGSTDRTPQILQTMDDSRIRIVRHEHNLGIPYARNTGLEHANGNYIAWLDSDDLCRPQRLQTQVTMLENNPQFAMIGSCAAMWDELGGRLNGVQVPPRDTEDIRAWHIFRSTFKQSSIMGLAKILQRYPYREELHVCEDYDVGIRISSEHPVANLYKVLVVRRFHGERTIYQQDDRFRINNKELQKQQIERLGLVPDDKELERHFLLPHLKRYGYQPDEEYLDWAEDWLNKLRLANLTSGYCDPEAFHTATAMLWIYACGQSTTGVGRLWSMRRMLRSPLIRAVLKHRGRRWLNAYIDLTTVEFLAGRLPGRHH